MLDFGVSTATAVRWWNGQSDPRRKDLLILSRLLDVSIEMLARDDLDLDFRANGAATSSPHPAAEAKPSRPKRSLNGPGAPHEGQLEAGRLVARHLDLLLSTLPAQAVRFLDELVDVLATKSMLRDATEKDSQFRVPLQVPLGLFTDTTTPRHQFVEFKRELNGDPSKHVLGWHAPIIFDVA